MKSDETPVITAYSRLAGGMLRVIRESHRGSTRPSGRIAPMSQAAYAVHMARVLGLEGTPSRNWWMNWESGRNVPAAVVLAAADDGGWELEEALSMALHRMVHEDYVQIIRRRDPLQRDRISRLLEQLRQLHEQTSDEA